jgi:hypothetical protein
MLSICEMLGAPKHLAQIEATKEVRKATGIDLEEVLKLSPDQDDINPEEIMLEPKELAEILDIRSAIALNNFLQKGGYQKKINNNWEPTCLGVRWCAKHAWTKGSKSGYNLKWNVGFVRRLVKSEG